MTDVPLVDPLRERLVADGMRLYASGTAKAGGVDGEIAVVLFRPDPEWQDALRLVGWKGDLVFTMDLPLKLRLSCSDPVTERWLTRTWTPGAPRRVFVVAESESFLVNCGVEGAFSLEPGSTDEDVGSANIDAPP